MLVDLFKRRRGVVTLSILIVFILALVFVFFRSTQNPNGNELTIANLNEYTSGKPTNQERVNWIQHSLYTTVSYNVDNKLRSNSVDDIFIRSDSFSQTYNEDTDVNQVTFIVDSMSLGQSYAIFYEWNSTGEWSEDMDGYGSRIECLPIHKLKYKDFGCVDQFILEQGVDNYDPIQKVLPYHVESKYKVTRYSPEDHTLTVEAYAPRWVASLDTATLDNYKKEVNEWISSVKLKPSDYTIVFLY
ncbi:MAG: hypothetical protein ACSLEY_03245 [Candidatus Saccharimonadales bacterium]